MLNIENQKIMYCDSCGEETEHAHIKDGKYYKWVCKKCRSKWTQMRRDNLKKLALEYLGNKCVICGYDRCKNALEFHHIDPSTKDFGIGEKGYTRSWEKNKNELDKCILVCSNCHREIHSGIINLEDYTKEIQYMRENTHDITYDNKQKKELKKKEEELNLKKKKETKEKEIQNRIEKIKNSKIDFTKVGWKSEVARLIGIKKTNDVLNFIEKNMPDIYEICLKKKIKLQIL